MRVTSEEGTTLERRRGPVPSWISGSLVATIAATAAALLPLGAPDALAAGASHVPATTLLHNACTATLGASAVHAHGQVSTGGKSMTLDVYWGSGGDLITLTQGADQTVHAIVDGPSTYFEGNHAFWQSVTNSSGTASLLSDRWIDMTSDTKDAASLTQSVNKTSILKQCGQGWSTSYVGSGTVNGVKAKKVHQDSNKESNTYYIENGSTPYILRVTGSPSQKDSGNLLFSGFGVQPNIAAPPNAIPISQFEG
ncbi:MAG TPA: hypothetical protein VK773_11040 [Acidimicrobiales bacterium]|nr:hypothetical protein [Acidimicrobiales bacterium]